MAKGRSHDRATWLLALPFALLWAPGLGLAGMGTAGLSFLVGGLLLSPDLDTRSNATRRWGPLRLLWWPYREGALAPLECSPTRPLLGTAGRLAYLALLALAWQRCCLFSGGRRPRSCWAGPGACGASSARWC